jgi:hypothetical protein
MTYTNIGKDDWKVVRVSLETYLALQVFCKEHGFKTWSGAVKALIQEHDNPDRPR